MYVQSNFIQIIKEDAKIAQKNVKDVSILKYVSIAKKVLFYSIVNVDQDHAMKNMLKLIENVKNVKMIIANTARKLIKKFVTLVLVIII